MIDIDAEIAFCQDCISHLGENAGPDHVVVKYLEVLRYAERLEAAYLEAEAENLFHQEYGDSDWDNHPDEDYEGHHGRDSMRQEAHESLEAIRKEIIP